MGKFKKGQQLIIEKNVAISIDKMNGQEVNDVADYPKGEVVEILRDLGNGSYLLEFWTDLGMLIGGKSVTYEFDEETIESWLEEEVE